MTFKHTCVQPDDDQRFRQQTDQIRKTASSLFTVKSRVTTDDITPWLNVASLVPTQDLSGGFLALSLFRE